MFAAEADWIEGVLAGLELPAGTAVADLGSSTLAARTQAQPFIDRQVHEPLRRRGLDIVHVDAKRDPGVDLVADLAAPGFDPVEKLGRRFDLVLCTGLLNFVRDADAVLAAVSASVQPGGFLLASAARRYRYTRDPVDNGWRPDPQELAAALRRHRQGLEMVDSICLRIDDSSEYRRVIGRGHSTIRVGRRYVPVPGWSEELRYALKRYRWQHSVVLLRAAA